MDEQDYTEEAILKRMLNKVSNSIDKREGSIIYDALSPIAAEIAKSHIDVTNKINLTFADTSVGEYLDKIVSEDNIIRQPSTFSIKKALFYNSENSPMDVAIGSRFTCGELYWTIIEKISTGVYQIQCEEEGVAGNNITGNLIPIDYIDGLARAELTDLLIPGEDEEDDETLRARYQDSTRKGKSFSGNVPYYILYTKELPGVGAVKVTPVRYGGGTVGITILDSDFNKASDVLIKQVQDSICPDKLPTGLGIAPIDHEVTVETVEEIKMSISAKLTITESSDIQIVKTEVEKVFKEYLLELRKSWENVEKIIVRIAQIESRILNISSVIDVTDVTLNNNTSNIELEEMQIPIAEEVEVS